MRNLDIGAAVENLPDLKKNEVLLTQILTLSGGVSVQDTAFSGNTDDNKQIAMPISEGDKKASKSLEKAGFSGDIRRKESGAGYGVRTRDIKLGKLALYQLS